MIENRKIASLTPVAGGNNGYEREFSEGMADIIGSKEHVEYRNADRFQSNECIKGVCDVITQSTNTFGGAATLNRHESLTRNVQIFVSRNAHNTAAYALEGRRLLGISSSSDGHMLLFRPEQVDAHEFGHAHKV